MKKYSFPILNFWLKAPLYAETILNSSLFLLSMKIILLGPPGSGKGTVADKLEKEFKFKHISAGQLLREEVAKSTTIGKDIKNIIEKGILVPDELVTQIVKLEIRNKKNYILDGFPRTVPQAQEITDLRINIVIYLDIAEKEVITRLSGRRVCSTGEHNYHLQYIPPKKTGICDVDGTKLVQRKDDAPEVIRERFRVYNKLTKPVAEYYRKKGVLKTVNAAQTPEKVYGAVKRILKNG